MKFFTHKLFSILPFSLQLYFLEKKDRQLIQDLERQDVDRAQREARITHHQPRNRVLAKILKDLPAEKPIPQKTFQQINQYLTPQETYKISFFDVPWTDIDQDKTVWKNVSTLRLAKAAKTTQWPMGHQIWIRDLVRIARCLLQSARLDNSSKNEGLCVLMSALTLMSSCSQLKRFQSIIYASQSDFVNDKKNWPSIFISQDDLLSTKPSGWAQKQDAFQMLALELIEALEHKEIQIADLSTKHKEFLGLLIPFLAKIKFWQQPNSGSWEELEAVRTSVVALDTLLIYKLSELSKQKEFSFITQAYEDAWQSECFSSQHDLYDSDFACTVEILIQKGTQKLLNEDDSLTTQECVYPPTDPRFRDADATLIYLLDYSVLPFVAQRKKFSDQWIQTQEKNLLRNIDTLTDPTTGGIKRYLDDSYMDGNEYHTYFDHKISHILTKKVYVSDTTSTVSGANDAGAKQFLHRRKKVPGNTQSKAAWTHPLAQLVSWAGRRYDETKDTFYRDLQFKFYRRLLSLITDKNEKTISNEGACNASIVKPIREACLPEAYITLPTSTQTTIRCPGPHAPLHWAVAETIRATAYIKNTLDNTSQNEKPPQETKTE